MTSLNSPTSGDDREPDPSSEHPEPGPDDRELDLSGERPGTLSYGTEWLQIEVQLPNQFRVVVVGPRLLPVVGFAVVCVSAAALGAAAAFVSHRVGAQPLITALVAAGTGVCALCLGLIWLIQNKSK